MCLRQHHHRIIIINTVADLWSQGSFPPHIHIQCLERKTLVLKTNAYEKIQGKSIKCLCAMSTRVVCFVALCCCSCLLVWMVSCLAPHIIAMDQCNEAVVVYLVNEYEERRKKTPTSRITTIPQGERSSSCSSLKSLSPSCCDTSTSHPSSNHVEHKRSI